ncbi:SdrD B-like domain-containing protein [Streptomyces sp. NRRL WC-3742]|uniref:SdrD B-like domain-containing protein n=1 Tax=Streptomyces sp. NRRL WC-3742 TaxID=1463934 RepID=UPI000AC76256|nr:SdrD B-like domain-containing protein [Streptomyces sp. NRRL WC-3742]
MTTTREQTAAAKRGRRAVGRITAVAVGIGACSLAAAPAAHPQTQADGTVAIRVVRAVDTSGKWTPVLEPGIGGVKVTLTDDSGNGIDGTTAADGTVTLSPAGTKATGGKYRVQVVNPKPGVLFPAFASRQGLDGAPDQLSSNEEFVDLSGGKTISYTTGLWNPGDYCQKNATLVTTCQPAGREAGSARTLVSFPYDARGVDGTDVHVTDISTKAETGNIYGIAWNKTDKRVFSTAQAKRTADYGPGGPGAIYVTDLAQKKTSLWATVPNAGTTAHGTGTDDAFTDVAGRESLGGVKITEDGKDLFVVNLNDRKLYRYDASAATAAAPKAVYPIPDPGCPAAGDWRPFGLGLQDGLGYLGGVCSAEPEIGEIGFETDGSMLVAFRDRFADRGPAGPSPGTAGQILSGGDLNKACLANGTYVLDTNLGCGITTPGKRFFDTSRMTFHHNAAFAGMALSKVESTIATSGFDPDNLYAVGYGTAWVQRLDGKPDPKHGLRLNPVKDAAPFGKGASMGDLEVLCDQAPLQIGNRVWYDPERKGVQLPGQKPVEGATVHLYDESGKLVGTARTTKRGEYYFDDSTTTPTTSGSANRKAR